MKTYEKGNQVYTAQEGSMLELELIARGFKEVVEKETDINKMKLDELKSYAESAGIVIPDDVKKKEDVLAFIKEQQEGGE
ncbi:hypothetical protein [Streptococcus equi]|uniref:hypothetical protein n=1 Tax=Streptococcus equi TaxID=1336 RepID=UPI00065A4663|nr:hypothetical protein [Streptococcus equi]MBT1201702.1 hypothetical protein [Streptococcus equi subsp. equi]MBT1208673.1 hypothetical protein [Streptococcus equi subsp. equi]MBT1212110.1 hypothetical protein [Streptococcus equi subsp. equi]MBT1216892.1 hypothetical protein [Streptococcus equi subsp. equi]MCD3371735.1 hypothetical protein [Streptococcus equi subsp. zooepidemicus]